MSCNTNAIPVGATVTSAVLTLRTTSVFGGNNPFLAPQDGACCGNVSIQVDLVSACSNNPLPTNGPPANAHVL